MGATQAVKDINKKFDAAFKEAGHVLWYGETTKTTEDKKKASEAMWDSIIWWAAYAGGSILLVGTVFVISRRVGRR